MLEITLSFALTIREEIKKRMYYVKLFAGNKMVEIVLYVFDSLIREFLCMVSGYFKITP